MNHETHELEERLQADFKFFLSVIWEFLNLPPPTPVQYAIADYLQHGPTRSIIQAFRGCGKSWITSAFVVWVLYCDPQKKVMVVSASGTRADAFSLFTKRLIADIPWLRHLKQQNSDQRDSLIAFDVGPAMNDHSPSVKSVGITGQLTGSRADVIVADDVEVPGNSSTQTAREKLATLVTEFAAILKPFAPEMMDSEPRVIYLGTPQCEMSLYNDLSINKGYDRQIIPAQFPGEEELASYKGELAPLVTDYIDKYGLTKLRGRSIEPRRFTEADLADRQIEYGKAGYALQFMLNTALSDAEKYPLKLSDLVVYDSNIKLGASDFSINRGKDTKLDLMAIGLAGDYLYRPDWVSTDRLEYKGKVLVVDPSGRGKDETTWCVVYQLNGYLHLMHMGASLEGYSAETLDQIAADAKEWNVNEVVVESNMGDGMFLQLLKPVLFKAHKCATSEVRQSTQKEKRIIDTLEPVMAQHRLVVRPSVLEWDYKSSLSNPNYSLMYQMTRMCDERGAVSHDDRVDCLELAVGHFVNAMAADAEKNDSKRRADQLQLFLKDKSMMFATGAEVVLSAGYEAT